MFCLLFNENNAWNLWCSAIWNKPYIWISQPLWKIYSISLRGGVIISNGLAHWILPQDTSTLSVVDLINKGVCILNRIAPYAGGRGGHSHMSVDIKYLSKDPLFSRQSYTQWPPFVPQSAPNYYLFFHFRIKF